MASELQRRKTAVVFRAMDVNGDGFLERGDFEALTERWTENRGLTPGSAAADRLSAIMMGWWDALRQAASSERIALDDVLSVVDRLAADTSPVVATADAMFEAIDASGDGRIDAAEYNELIETWTGLPTDTDEVFELLDLDGDGHLSEAEFRVLWTEFWAGDDENAPGTWVFGRFDLPAAAA